jgi:hypothetical protein
LPLSATKLRLCDMPVKRYALAAERRESLLILG